MTCEREEEDALQTLHFNPMTKRPLTNYGDFSGFACLTRKRQRRNIGRYRFLRSERMCFDSVSRSAQQGTSDVVRHILFGLFLTKKHNSVFAKIPCSGKEAARCLDAVNLILYSFSVNIVALLKP